MAIRQLENTQQSVIEIFLLQIHNEYNENNIAISPYGAISVLIALGEGLEGDAVYEIQQAAHVPHDISVIRVGLRDIHRHLKSYFIPKEGFLAGLTLNHDNVTLRPEYEDILRFYGYDTVSFNNALYPEPETTEIPQSTNGEIITTEDVTTALTTEKGRIETADENTTDKVAGATTEFETTTAKVTTTTDAGKMMTLFPEISTNKITTQQTTLTLPTTQEISTSTILPQTAATETVSMEPRTIEMTTMEVSSTTTELTTPQATVTRTEKPTTTESPTTSERITSEEETTVVSTTTPTEDNAAVEITAQSTRTTRSITPTTILTTTNPLTTLITTTESITSIGTTETDSTTELTTTENFITTSLFKTTTNLPTTMQNNITTLSLISDTAIDNTSTSLTTFTISSTSAENINGDSTTLSTVRDDVSETTNADITSSFLNTNLVTTTSASYSTINPDNNAIYENESTTMTVPSESTENLINMDNEIDNDASVNDTVFGGTYKRNTHSGEDINKQTNVVELNMRETRSKNSDKNSNQRRRSRSVVDYIIARYYDDHYIPHHRPYTPKEQLSFLVYGKYREYNINFMKYDTVLPFHYVPHLDALALSFPLDSTKYYLLLLLPVHETGIDKLICDLRLNGSLRYIIANLKYTHVVATIPSFMLKGYVTLTPSFQKLGIRKVFEPRQADFSPMTNQRGIYVTNIEQAITVTIRNYVDPDTIENYGKCLDNNYKTNKDYKIHFQPRSISETDIRQIKN
ncbi:hypothetical protein NQ314_008994 [Rhamnusium bicolor]|uniref:Serpin domain-containing protein n=1 Tax=Rhamnusium bicolor TaxID=1586634 RepID=A0AAV8Y3N0_9CUCU|nr:hypothetical protein NQ314_008994 [Rhamnusium bicolor]